MKKILWLLVGVIFSVGVYADTIEVKTGHGYKAKTTTVYGSFKSRYESRFPYVCYDKRVKVIVDGDMFLSYKGCKRYDAPCSRLGRAHFGKYPHDLAAYKALGRCKNARPRFVD